LTDGSSRIDTVAALRAIVPAASAAIAAKKLTRLDLHAARFAALSPLVGLAAQGDDGRLGAGLRAGAPGLVRVSDPATLFVADRPGERLGARIDELPEGAATALLLLLPGRGEMLRVNGRGRRTVDRATLASAFGAAATPPAALRVEVEEAFLHCAKAVLRARLWDDTPSDEVDPLELRLRSDVLEAPFQAFLARAPFALLATCDAAGRADLSPRGDPPGFLRALDERTLLLPDRRGNRLLDSFSNLLEGPSVALLALVPGESAALLVRGRGRLTDHAALLAGSAVEERPPVLGLVVEVHDVQLHRAPALRAAGVWRPESRALPDALPSLGRMLVEQQGGRGLRGAVTARLVEAALGRDARKLY
jgi:PPOX class probable FMN-dependent enzyme